MKFISKNPNLNIILRPGLPAQPLTGTPAQPTIFVRFKDGVADVTDEKLIEMMKNHPGYQTDFVSAGDETESSFAGAHVDDVQYVHTEIKYGHPVKRTESPIIKKLPPEVYRLARQYAIDMAKRMTKEMLPNAVKATLSDMIKDGSISEDALKNIGDETKKSGSEENASYVSEQRDIDESVNVEANSDYTDSDAMAYSDSVDEEDVSEEVEEMINMSDEELIQGKTPEKKSRTKATKSKRGRKPGVKSKKK